jgi:hypothetical protein
MDKQIITEQVAQPVAAKIATTASIGGGLTAFAGGMTLNEMAMATGMVVGVVGLIVQVVVQGHGAWIRHIESRRQAVEHQKRMDLLNEQITREREDRPAFLRHRGGAR